MTFQDDGYPECVYTLHDPYSKSTKLNCGKCTEDICKLCKHIYNYILDGLDASEISPESTIGFNTLMSKDPEDELGWINLQLGPELAGGASLITLNYTADTSANIKQVLGIRNIGEGRYVMAGIVMDWILSRSDPAEVFTPGEILTKCKSPMHNYNSQKIMQEMSSSRSAKNLNLFSMALEGCCYVCYSKSIKNDDNYGLDDMDDKSFQKKFQKGGPGQAPGTARHINNPVFAPGGSFKRAKKKDTKAAIPNIEKGPMVFSLNTSEEQKMHDEELAQYLSQAKWRKANGNY